MDTKQGIVKLKTPRQFSTEGRDRFPFSANTRRFPPVGKGSLSQQSIVNCFETMTCDSEQIVNQAMD